MRSKLLLAPRASEESPFVREDLGANFENPQYLGLKKLHTLGVVVRAGETFVGSRRRPFISQPLARGPDSCDNPREAQLASRYNGLVHSSDPLYQGRFAGHSYYVYVHR